MKLEPKSWDELMQAVYIFAAVGIGFEFPDTAIMGRSSRSIAGAVTWGRRQPMTRAFYETFNDESFAIVFPEELRNGMTERGFDLAGLNAALARI